MTQARKMLFGGTFAFTIIVALQCLHFIFYFNQPIALSMIWSIVDWSVWFVLFAGLLIHSVYNDKTKLKINPYIITFCFIAVAGIIQIIVSSGIYYIIFDGNRPLWESIARSLDKRWFQNILIASVISLITNVLLQKLLRPETDSESKSNRLKLFDGKNYHQVNQSDIVAVCANKNYVSVYTADREIVVRSTLKELSDQLTNANIKQISRSAFVNSDAIDGLHKYSRTSYRVMLNNQHEFNVSKTYLNNIQGLLS